MNLAGSSPGGVVRPPACAARAAVRRAGGIIASALLLALAAACGEGGPAAGAGPLPAGATRLGTSALWISVPSARVMPAMAMGAAYFTVHNRGDAADRLLAVTTASGSASLHETVLEGDVSKMRERLDGFPIGPGEDLVLQPGGRHVMITALATDGDAGAVDATSLALVLRFERAGSFTVDVPVETP